MFCIIVCNFLGWLVCLFGVYLFIKFFSFENIAGIWAGMHTVRYFDGKTYEWVGISRQPNILGKVCNELIKFLFSLLAYATLFH